MPSPVAWVCGGYLQLEFPLQYGDTNEATVPDVTEEAEYLVIIAIMDPRLMRKLGGGLCEGVKENQATASLPCKYGSIRWEFLLQRSWGLARYSW